MVASSLVNHCRADNRVSSGLAGDLLPCQPGQGLKNLSTAAELSEFLCNVERRAFKHAVFAVRDDHIALDIVQDAMLKLAEKYGGKPVEELPMLFQRILQNTIRDHYRRQKVRSSWITLFSALQPKRDEEEFDLLDVLEDSENQTSPLVPDEALQQRQIIALVEQALGQLPPRQREAFLLRYWEGMDTAETAVAMGCTEGSVKTHCSRAVHALAASLKAKGVELP
jgi:RNA polymerase sigma-70 factor (ECF subfamily)